MKRKEALLLLDEQKKKIHSIQQELSTKGEEALKKLLPERIILFESLIKKYYLDSTIKDLEIYKPILKESEKAVEKIKEIALETFSGVKSLVNCTEIELKVKLPTILKSYDTLNEKLGKINHVKEVISIPSNSIIVELLSELREVIVGSLDVLSKIKIWIQLKVPKMEDGNNFGVSIQEDCIDECVRTEDISFNLLETTTRVFVDRGELISKLVKFPVIGDLYQSLIQFDRMQQLLIKFGIKDLRDHYSIIYDMINKNIEKIEKPRSNSHFRA